jgi:lipopolysaccharide transport protein LptA/LPS export ABC transporter protein LptC
MTSMADGATGAGRDRVAGSGIALAGDRTQSRRKAERHSVLVKTLKYTLPLFGLSMTGIYALAVLRVTGWGAGIPELTLPTIVPENIAMENPHYDGFSKDGGRYWVTAKTARQDLKNLALIHLNDITGDFLDAQKAKTHLTAARGTFNNKANTLELFDSIDVAGDNGLKSHLTRANVQVKENIITSNEPVVVMMEAGTINSNQMTIRQKTKEYTFVDKVRTFLKGKDKDKEKDKSASDPETGLATPKKQQQAAFGSSDDPIDIVSQRLDVDDVKKTALFTGNVKAVQGTASLATPEMLVAYEGSAAPASSAQPAQQSASGSKLKHISAKEPVVLTQADGQTVTCRSAEFDAQTQKSVLEGDVIMAQVPDKRATGDRADLDQAANTVLLTGNVVVTQGPNILKGRRLFYNRATSQMQMTSPGGGPAARVFSHFQQTAAAAAPAAPAQPKTDAVQGFAMGGNFKTDPKAPVDIESDRLDLDDAKKEAVFNGDVHAAQGDFVIRASELIANYTGSAALNDSASAAKGKQQEAAHLTRLRAKKNVVVTSKDGQNATGDTADFDTAANTVTLGGNVVMTQNKNVVRGTKLVIDMATGESVIRTEPTANAATGPMTSSTDGNQPGMIIKSGRPSAVFYPNMMKDAASAAKSAKKAVTGGWDPGTQPQQQPSKPQ